VDSDCEVGDFGSTLISLGYNLIATHGSGCQISGDLSSNLLNVDPMLGARTIVAGMPIQAPLLASPAVNATPRAACVDGGGFAVVVDGRGAQRPSAGSNFCDIGAIEVDLPLFADGFE
jgi:hypothetical protein